MNLEENYFETICRALCFSK